MRSVELSSHFYIQFVETTDDGERDWGAHVRGGEDAADKLRSKADNLASN